MKTLMILAATTAAVLTAVMQAEAEEATAEKEVAVMCAKCESVWVKSPRVVGKATIYVSTKKMACDECKSAIENFFTSGKLEHACGNCGDLVACEVAQEEAGTAPKEEGSTFVPGTSADHQHHTIHPK